MDKIRTFRRPISYSQSKILSENPLFFRFEIISNLFQERWRDEIDPLYWAGNVVESRASKNENVCFVAAGIADIRTRNSTRKKKACETLFSIQHRVTPGYSRTLEDWGRRTGLDRDLVLLLDWTLIFSGSRRCF